MTDDNLVEDPNTTDLNQVADQRSSKQSIRSTNSSPSSINVKERSKTPQTSQHFLSPSSNRPKSAGSKEAAANNNGSIRTPITRSSSRNSSRSSSRSASRSSSQSLSKSPNSISSQNSNKSLMEGSKKQLSNGASNKTSRCLSIQNLSSNQTMNNVTSTHKSSNATTFSHSPSQISNQNSNSNLNQSSDTTLNQNAHQTSNQNFIQPTNPNSEQTSNKNSITSPNQTSSNNNNTNCTFDLTFTQTPNHNTEQTSSQHSIQHLEQTSEQKFDQNASKIPNSSPHKTVNNKTNDSHLISYNSLNTALQNATNYKDNSTLNNTSNCPKYKSKTPSPPKLFFLDPAKTKGTTKPCGLQYPEHPPSFPVSLKLKRSFPRNTMESMFPPIKQEKKDFKALTTKLSFEPVTARPHTPYIFNIELYARQLSEIKFLDVEPQQSHSSSSSSSSPVTFFPKKLIEHPLQVPVDLVPEIEPKMMNATVPKVGVVTLLDRLGDGDPFMQPGIINDKNEVIYKRRMNKMNFPIVVREMKLTLPPRPVPREELEKLAKLFFAEELHGSFGGEPSLEDQINEEFYRMMDEPLELGLELEEQLRQIDRDLEALEMLDFILFPDDV